MSDCAAASGLAGRIGRVSIRLPASESDPAAPGNPSRAGARGFARFRPDPPRNLAKPNTPPKATVYVISMGYEKITAHGVNTTYGIIVLLSTILGL
jgi:hypothetical protein